MAPSIRFVIALCVASLALTISSSIASQATSATQTSINGPGSLAVDGHGNIFVIEMGESKVRKIDLRRGVVSTVAGNGKKCCYKDGAKATKVSLESLRSLAVDSQGNIFIGEIGRIKRIDAQTGVISTVAGDGEGGSTVDGVSALAAHFWGIDGLAVDTDGNLFAADEFQEAIFKIDLKTGIVHRYAGSGEFGYSGDGGTAVDASFRFPSTITIDKDGNLIIADYQNCAIRRVDRETSLIKTIAVTGGAEQACGGAADNLRPGPYPGDPVSDKNGNIYFLEEDMVLRIDANTSAVSIFAGTGQHGFSGDGGVATRAELANPSGLAIDAEGNVFISVYFNNRVRRVDAKTKVITTVAGDGLPPGIEEQL